MADYEDLIPTVAAGGSYDDLIPKQSVGYEDLIPTSPETASLQPVFGVGQPTEPIVSRPITAEESVELGRRPSGRIVQVGTTSGAHDSLLDFIPEVPKLSEEQALLLGSVPIAGAPMGPTAARAVAGAANVPIQFAKGATTPMGLVALGPGMLARGGAAAMGTRIGATEAAALHNLPSAQAIRPIFAAEMGTGAVRAIPETIEAAREGDVQGAVQTGLGGVASGLLARQLVQHSTPAQRIVAEAAASPTPRTAATVAGMREVQIATADPFAPKPGMVRIFDTGQPKAKAVEVEATVAPESRPLLEAPRPPVEEAPPVIAPTPEATLAAKINELPAKSPTMEAVRESIEEQQKLGIRPTPPPIFRGTPILDVAKGVVQELTGVRKFTPFRETLNEWQGRLQDSSMKIEEDLKAMESRVPSERKRNAITNWIQADGDATVLTGRAKTTKNRKLQEGYLDALRLTPDELKIANEVRTFYANKATELKNAGILDNVVDNYVTQIWKREPLSSVAQRFAGKLARNFKFNKARTFATFHEGEQAGFKPATKDISKLVAVYTAEADKVLATRKMIQDLTSKTASDGRPLAVPSGIVKLSAESEPGTRLVLPNLTGKDFSEYVEINHPALAKWKWAEKDPETGVNAMVLGNLKIHPEAAKYVRNALDRPWLRKWYDEPSGPALHVLKGGIRALDRAGGEMKRTMLSVSPFHIVQEGTHAVFHRVDPFFGLPEIKSGDPKIQDAMNHGLMLASDHTGAQHFKEGIIGGGLIEKIPVVGQVAKELGDFTFKVYIPKLKYATYEKMVARNNKVFEKELASGEVTRADVKALSAEQSNAAYGHLNYADMGRNPNFQHLLRTILLAPDFLEARGRFAGQAIKGIVSKTGKEQLHALAFGAGLFWIASRIGNQLNDGDPHYERPFEVKVGNRWFSMRSVPEDIFKLFKDTRRFISGRLSPMFGQTGMELITGRNWRGEKIEASEALRETATRWIPLSFRGIPGLKNLSESTANSPVTPWENFVGTAGLHVSRYSPITETYKLAGEWKDKQGLEPDRGTYPVSKYQQLRYALEDADMEKAAAEISKLRKAGLSKDKLRSGFRASVLHPFTQSRDMDEQFKSSLKGNDRKTYEEAVFLRRDMIRKLDSVLR